MLLFFSDNDPAPTINAPAGWTQVEAVGSTNQNGRLWRKTATATDQTNADFRPRSHAFSSTHAYYRVLVRVVWYRNGHVDGKAWLYPFFYGVVVLDSFDSYVPWYCPDPLVS